MNTIRCLLIFFRGYRGASSVLWALAVMVSLTLTSCTQHAEETQEGAFFSRYQYTQLHLGVQVKIVLYAEKEEHAIRSATKAFSKIATLEDIFSSYRQESEINRLINASPYEPVYVSKDLLKVLLFSQNLSKETEGAFDITLGPYISLWREARATKKLPSMPRLESATDKVGWHLIETDTTASTVKLNQKGMLLNLGGIAKGYILDEAMDVLTAEGIQSALIEAGGDIVVSAAPPESKGWIIEIPGADSTAQISLAARSLVHGAISTSGDTEQFIEIDGTRYSHVIDPATGLGSTRREMVTVIAPSGLVSDSYATALGVMSDQERQDFLSRHPDVIAYIRQNK